MSKPVFFDPSGRRSRVSKRIIAAALVIAVAAALLFATTLLAVTRHDDLAMPLPQMHGLALKERKARGFGSWLPHRSHAGNHKPLTIGFYVPGEDASIASLRRHIYALDWVVPAKILLSGPNLPPTVLSDPRFDRMIAAMHRPPKIMPMVQNLSRTGWDAAGTAAVLQSPTQRRQLAAQLALMTVQGHYGGLVLDIESLPPSAQLGYYAFLAELRRAMPAGAQIAVTVPSESTDHALRRFAALTDHVILMAYDQHWQGGTAGPIASQGWFVAQVEQAQRAVPQSKLIVALGSYGYDWHGGEVDALPIEDAWLAAHDSKAPVAFDQVSGNATFSYSENGQQHMIWMMDAATSWNQLLALRRLGVDDIAMWRLGTEDPDFWGDLTAYHNGTAPNLSAPKSLLNAEVEGTGEILRITATPTPGKRLISRGPHGIIRDERYTALPTPYVVKRSGAANPKLLALTFDDGPDATWTPQILRELEAAHVPATFFVIGENALEHPELLNRIVSDGSELGNHTYTHPNLATVSATGTRLELNTTQRLVEAYTGRRMTLFRAPYFGDAEPTTTDELGPALEAQQAGYTVVGLHVDAEDWQRPGVDAIVNQVINQVHQASPDRSANVILLHDGGGNRAQTVAALPRIIDALRAQGYRFVPVSQLIGLPQSAAMPPVGANDLWAVRTDAAAFITLALMAGAIAWLFYLAISLGMARAVIMAALAWFQSRRKRPDPQPFEPAVSVIIPAFNEEQVIAVSVRRVLASDYPALQVIVVDDGSKDRTSAIVAAQFGGDPRVSLLTLPNGGKAAALNRALKDATGEVVIALDADTQFEPETIRRLARWFIDPAIGAMAGDARVGNRVNLVTRWQAVEYITAQNLERRALAGFDAMTVVPGAVGAWRRAALDAVGGYPEDTLAEDQDLTIAIQRAGWRVSYDPRATAWTEAPESFRALARQRYRWAFGTLQCLWKHRAILRSGKPSGLALVGLPQAWLFQIFFAAVSPLIDLALILSVLATALRVQQHGWYQTQGDVGAMALYWLAFTAVDVLCGWIAYRLDGHRTRYPAHLLVAQRLVYRQIMYWVVLRAISSAIGGFVVGWGKLERSGRVTAAQPMSDTFGARAACP